MRIPRFVLMAVFISSAFAGAQQAPTVLSVTTVLDGRGGIVRDTKLVVEGSRIVAIDPDAQGVTYDLTGLTVMPGWIDTHVHSNHHFDRETGRAQFGGAPSEADEAMRWAAQGALYEMQNLYATLMAGFTTVQSLGSARFDIDFRVWIAEGRIPGPRLLTCIRPVRETTGSPDEIRAFVRQLVAEGADVIKIRATASIRDGGAQTMTDEQIQAACGEAKVLGRRSAVHAQAPEGAKAAVLAGCTTIEHGNRLTDEVLDLMVQHGTYLDTHNGLLLHNYIENKHRYLGIGNWDEEGFAYMEKGVAIGIDTFKRALRKDVKIVFGTDAVAGAHGRNFEEFVYRVRDGGQDPMEAMVSATSLAAESLGMQDKIGTIAPGMEADIIALDGDPLRDITAVRRVVFVMKGGRIFKNESLNVGDKVRE